MADKKVKVRKGTVVKTIYENELATYLAMGWVEEKSAPNPYGFTKVK